jgi:GWxTD domain-containing protein
MRKLIFTAIASIIGLSAFSKDIQAYYNSKQFKLEGKGTLVENYLSISPHSVVYKSNSEGKLLAQIEITQIYKQGETIVDFKKYVLTSPEIGSDSIADDFIDQQRYILKPGDYIFELEMLDLNDDKSVPFKYQEEVTVQDFSSKLNFSDAQFIESYSKTETPSEFTKSGYDIIPMVLNHLASDVFKLAYYAELYLVNASDDMYLLTQYLEDFETSRQLSNYAKGSKVKNESITPILNVFNIQELPSGKYNLVFQLRNKDGIIVAEKKTFFTRENPTKFDINNFLADNVTNTFVDGYTDADLSKYIKCLQPIASTLENSVIKRVDSLNTDMKKRFFYSFWKQRDEVKPEDKWLAYNLEVEKVEKEYATRIKRGYETERGRVYLKYGPPNSIMERPNESNSYPYEIWHYYRIDRFSNKRFVFYNPDLITNDYDLLHSDMYGERFNYRWQIDLRKRNTPFESVDDTRPINDTFGSPQDDLFRNPR